MGVYLPLPSEYQEVEYIQSSGTQRVEIGNLFKTSYKITIDFQMTATGGDQIPVGVREIISGTQYRYGINAYSSNFKVISGGSSWSNTKSEDTNRHIITINKTTATVDGTNYSCSYVDHTFNMGIYVFDYNIFSGSSNFPSKNRLYKLDVYDENGNHIHDVVPCYRKSDNVIGLYDLINSAFYTNSGSGTFSKGADVTAVPLKNAYIGGVYEYSYNFRNKTLAQIQSDGWTSYNKTPSFDADGMYSSSTSSSNDVKVKRLIPGGISTAKKITITLNYKWNSTVPGVNFGVNINSDNSSVTGAYLQGTARSANVDGSAVYSINNASSTAGTYSETLVLDLVNKTYTVSGHRSYTRTLTDAQITNLKAKTGLYVYSYRSNYVRVQDVKMAIEY